MCNKRYTVTFKQYCSNICAYTWSFLEAVYMLLRNVFMIPYSLPLRSAREQKITKRTFLTVIVTRPSYQDSYVADYAAVSRSL